jgi:transcriptional regulator with XRE-family HTH domain
MPTRTTIDPFAARIGERIRELRWERNMSLHDLSAVSGLGKGHLSDIENGRVATTVLSIQTIAKALEIPPLYLLAFPEKHPVAEAVELLRKKPDREVKRICRDLRKG